MSSRVVRAAVLLVIALARSARADEQPDAIGPPPSFGVVTDADGKGFVEYRFFTAVTVHHPDFGAKQVMTEHAVRQDLADDAARDAGAARLQVFDVQGKRVKKAEAAERLKQGMPVLVSEDGKPLSKFYLQHLKPDLLILAVPRTSDARPALLPNPTPRPKARAR